MEELLVNPQGNFSQDNLSGGDRLKARYAYAGDERDIWRAWENFLTGVSGSGYPVRLMVESSWKRSFHSGVNAHGSRSPSLLGADDFNELRKRNRLLSSAAASTLVENAELLKGTRSMLILTDPTGVILDVAGDQGTIDAGQEINLTGGGNWNECIVGTNAIGTAIAVGQAVQVHASEHFCEGVKKWTCAAAPIHDPRDKSLMGILDISGPDMSFCQHNLALALAASRHIETMLVEELLAERSHLLEACLNVKRGNDSGIVLLDHRGYVVYVNDDVTEQLNRGVLSSKLSVGKRLADAADTPTIEQLGDQLPPDLRSEWLHPVVAGGDTLGTLLVIPKNRKSTSLPSTVNRTKFNPAEADGFSTIFGDSDGIQLAIQRARMLARSTAPVLVEGETGVGKELFARAIHSASGASPGPLVSYNCGTASRDLIGSELFGYVKGAFTGASNTGRIGRFEEADGGTLCLDEIGELPLDLQPYLLRVLDEGVVYRLGENTPRKINVRLLALTNRDLQKEVDEGRFRADLYYRIGVTTVTVPPLRERQGDVTVLASYFNSRFALEYGVQTAGLSSDVLNCLERYSWPGNVRQLRNTLQTLLLTSEGRAVQLDDVPSIILKNVQDGNSSAGCQLKGLEESERVAIVNAISAGQGNLSRTAKLLGISRSTLYRKISHYEITINR